MVRKVSSETDQTAGAQVYNPECKEVATLAIATAIIDTGSTVTVFSSGVFQRIGEKFIDQQSTIKSNLNETSI